MNSFNLKEEIFNSRKLDLSSDSEVIFVADLFVEDYVGGAELTSEALISSCPLKIEKIKSQDVTLDILRQGAGKYWIFGNFAGLNPQLIPSIVANLKYSILEYDYKYCRYRSPEKHESITGLKCDCHEQMNGKLVSAFFHGSNSVWWMSQAQKEWYLKLFPFLSEKDNIVLSSVFSRDTLGKIKLLREGIKTSNESRKGWIVLGSDSWVKGFDDAKKWCEDNNKEADVLWSLPYDETLARLAASEGFVYLPKGKDTCPRMVIEAKLLGCKLHLNENVQHKDEEWFVTDDVESIEEYLYTTPNLFWNCIKSMINYKPTISGYTTTLNCLKQEYPFERSITSMLQFANEVCVVDGGSTDGTWEKLLQWADREPRLKLKQIVRDWNHPRFAVFDGQQKAEARKMCTGNFCWQMDSDEVVHEDDVNKIVDLCSKIPTSIDIVSLPVIEYWGGPEKVRCDIQPWKWRLSRNLPHITHGIPVELRRTDENGNLYAAEGTDGCDMIHTTTGERLNHVTFHNQDSELLRRQALSGHVESIKKYEEWFNAVVTNLPGVHHYSWYNMSRKIMTYKNYWTKHWNSLFNKSVEDTTESNMMFDMPWSSVTDQMIQEKAKELTQKTGGWIWHSKWAGQTVPHITVNRSEPK